MWTLTGFADEISPELEEQLETLAQESMGYMELRSVWNTNVLDLTDDELDRVKSATAGAVSGYLPSARRSAKSRDGPVRAAPGAFQARAVRRRCHGGALHPCLLLLYSRRSGARTISGRGDRPDGDHGW